MEATETKLIEFFREPMQMIVSSARSYKWTKKRCKKLWDDIIRAAENDYVSSYFIGTIIYVEQGILPRSHIPRFLLLDGQQRLVTLFLLLIALEEKDKKAIGKKDSGHNKIHDLLLYNSQEKGEFHYKLVLADKDQGAFLRIIRGEAPGSPDSSTLEQNYRFFKEKISDIDTDIGLIYKGIAKLTFMPISTDRAYENPHFIYKIINSTKLDKEQAALIRNWLGLLGSSPKKLKKGRASRSGAKLLKA